MGFWLNLLSAVVIVTGIFGIGAWTFGPTYLTRREREVPTEKAFALRDHYGRKVKDQITKLSAEDPPVLSEQLLGILTAGRNPSAEERDSLQTLARESGSIRDLMVLLGQHRRVESEWRRLRAIRRWMNTWRLVHVPCSVLLLALIVPHVFSIWYY